MNPIDGNPSWLTIAPGGQGAPLALATRNLPSAMKAVAISSETGGDWPGRGAAQANGLVPITRLRPPYGATAGPALAMAIPTMFAAATRSTYGATLPMW